MPLTDKLYNYTYTYKYNRPISYKSNKAYRNSHILFIESIIQEKKSKPHKHVLLLYTFKSVNITNILYRYIYDIPTT